MLPLVLELANPFVSQFVKALVLVCTVKWNRKDGFLGGSLAPEHTHSYLVNKSDLLFINVFRGLSVPI